MNRLEKIRWQENEIGFEFQNEYYFVFFGKALANIEKIKAKYECFQFVKIKQIHGDQIVNSDENIDVNDPVIGDAHFCSEENRALIISTADCLPVFLFNKKNQKIVAIHAGWRGIVLQIIKKSLLISDCEPKDCEFFIGPHIRKESFEIQENVLSPLMATARECSVESIEHFQKIFTKKKK